MKLCVHRASDIALNMEVPGRDKVFKCIKCGKTIKPIYGLGVNGSLVILAIMMHCFIKIPWVNSFVYPRDGSSGWVGKVLPWVGIAIVYFTIVYIALRYFIPIYREQKDKNS